MIKVVPMLGAWLRHPFEEVNKLMFTYFYQFLAIRRWAIGGLLAVIALSSLLFPFPAQAQSGERCFPETGYCISGPIREYWERNGGLAVFGYPITAPSIEQVENWSGPVQWFERDRLEDHSNQGQGVLAGRLGAQLLELQGRPWQSFPTVNSAPTGCVYFEVTRHSLCEPFLSYWRNNGGLERFGYPITEPIRETFGDWTGNVQYFERRRMEHHTEYAGTQYEVLLGLLGSSVRFDVFTDMMGKIVYTSTRDGSLDIWVMQPNGGGKTNLTRTPNVGEFQAELSPDGSKIAYVRGTPSTQDQDIWVMNADGSNARRLTFNEQAEWDPTWSPDGKQIAFATNWNGNADIYVINADGTGDAVNLTKFAPRTSEYSPAWSPDGKQIAYISDEGGRGPNVWILQVGDKDNTRRNVTNVNTTEVGYYFDKPAWLRDGFRLMAERKFNWGGKELFVFNNDGSSQQYLIYDASSPSVSPGGRSYVFSYANDIHVSNIFGGGWRSLTESPEYVETEPHWGN